MPGEFDLIVVGSGFAGSLTALIARKLGLSVLLLERGRHPRFAIGESSTPLANSLLEELCDRYDLPRIRPLSKWGTWQQSYPQIGCGLKRGFSFFHHRAGEFLGADGAHTNQLLVAASTSDENADTHWYRPDFDHFLVQEAQSGGVEYRDQFTFRALQFGSQSVQLEGDCQGHALIVRGKFVIDATGPRGFLHRALDLPEAPFEHLPGTQALFSHFGNVGRVAAIGAITGHEAPPYPIDDAALHHIFDGGWIWVLRFNNGLTSAGVAMNDDFARRLRLEEGGPAWDRLLERYPTIQAQFRDATAELPFTHSSRLSFRASQVTGPNWALLPSAAGFIDPLLSTGFTLTLLGVLRLGKAIQADWGTPRFAEALERYARQTTDELLAAERLVAALYAKMADFDAFRSLSLLYFAAVSFTEIARRLGRPQLATAFLLQDHPQFSPKARDCCAEALRPQEKGCVRSEDLHKRVLETIAPIDLMGLSDPGRKYWYPVRLEDVQGSAAKLGLSRVELDRILQSKEAAKEV